MFELEVVLHTDFGGFSFNEEMATWLQENRNWTILNDEDYDYLSIVGDDDATDNSFSDDNSTDSIDYCQYGGTWRNSGEKKNRRLFFSTKDPKPST